VTLELLYSARDAQDLTIVEAEQALLRDVPVAISAQRAAIGALRDLASDGPGQHRVPLAEALIAAAAQDAGLEVLHYDHHYDRLAQVLNFESVWIASPGTLERQNHPDWSRPLRFIRSLELFGEDHEGGRLYTESLGERQQELVGWVETSCLKRVNTLVAYAGGAGQLVGAHAPLLAHLPNRLPEEEQVCVSVFACGQEKLPICAEDDCHRPVSTYMP
jgi:hypothetical protein